VDYTARPISEFSVQELRAYAYNVVRLEVYRLVGAQQEVDAVFADFSNTHIDVALDTFAIQLRTLLGFFHPRGRPQPTDVLACHFFEVPDRWQPDPPSDLLLDGWNKANKQVAHLTTDRVDDPERNSWEPLGMTADLKPTILKVGREADYLHEDFEPMVTEYLDGIEKPPPPPPGPPPELPF
jgi:hypothetical protein